MSAANSRFGPVIRRWSMRSVSASGFPGRCGWSEASANSVMAMPPRRPNTTMSSSEFVPSRFAPCTETHAHSPAAYSPGTGVSSGPTTTRPSVSVGMPPIA